MQNLTIKQDLSKYVFSKVPPQALDLEGAVLGAMMLQKATVSVVMNILKPFDFYLEKNGKIFEAMQLLFLEREPIDILTVTQKLRFIGVLDEIGGAFYVSELTDRIASAANIEYWSRIVKQKSIERSIIAISSQAIGICYGGVKDTFEILDDLIKELMALQIDEGDTCDNRTLVDRAKENIIAATNRTDKSQVIGLNTGLKQLDIGTLGWTKSELTVVAARPGMGKTALALGFCKAAQKDSGRKAGIISMEMSGIRLIERFISSESGIPTERLRNGLDNIDELAQLDHWGDEVIQYAPWISDKPARNIAQVASVARKWKIDHDIPMLVVDYIQLCKAFQKGSIREQVVSEFSRGLVEIAKELDIPVIGLAQLNRDLEKRPDKHPQLSDLRESGAIEQDASLVLFLYRHEYYKTNGIKNTEFAFGYPCAGIAEIEIAKNRNGSLGKYYIGFNGPLTTFYDLEDATIEAIKEHESKSNSDIKKKPYSEQIKESFGILPEDQDFLS